MAAKGTEKRQYKTMKRNYHQKRRKHPAHRPHKRKLTLTNLRKLSDELHWMDFRAKVTCLVEGHRPILGAQGETICACCNIKLPSKYVEMLMDLL